MSKQPPPTPTASAIGPYPIIIPAQEVYPFTMTKPRLSAILNNMIFHTGRASRTVGNRMIFYSPVPGRPTILITVGQGPTALVVGAAGVCLDIFTLLSPFSPLSPSLWETARYRLKYCLKGPLNPK